MGATKAASARAAAPVAALLARVASSDQSSTVATLEQLWLCARFADCLPHAVPDARRQLASLA